MILRVWICKATGGSPGHLSPRVLLVLAMRHNQIKERIIEPRRQTLAFACTGLMHGRQELERTLPSPFLGAQLEMT